VKITELEALTRDELMTRAKEAGVSSVSGMKKQDLIFRLMQAQSEKQG
jgi:transcription termination factor Rho